tara:strand:+ start:286 stop:1299 length:1014 start_codon:yes stop_codon:yes gene_type:complete
MVALLDADIIAYRAASVSQDDIEWPDGSYGWTLSSQQAKDSARHIINQWMNGSKHNSVALCWSSSGNFRKEVDPTYKANRKGEKPFLYNEVSEWMKQNYESYAVDRLEADDVMAIYHTAGTNSVIVSIDKDMQTVPGHVYNPDKDRAPRRITVGQADRFWMLQVLQGDRADGIQGIPRVGPKKAEKILANVRSNLPDMWAVVVAAYRDAGLTEDDAINTARLTRILRHEDYDMESKEIKLWHPIKPTRIRLKDSNFITEETGANPSTSSKAKTSDSTKETSSSTSADTEGKEESQTSLKRSTTSRGSSRKKPRRKNKRASTSTLSVTSTQGEVDEVA